MLPLQNVTTNVFNEQQQQQKEKRKNDIDSFMLRCHYIVLNEWKKVF